MDRRVVFGLLRTADAEAKGISNNKCTGTRIWEIEAERACGVMTRLYYEVMTKEGRTDTNAWI